MFKIPSLSKLRASNALAVSVEYFFVFGDDRHQFVGLNYCPFCGRVLSRELWNLEKKK